MNQLPHKGLLRRESRPLWGEVAGEVQVKSALPFLLDNSLDAMYACPSGTRKNVDRDSINNKNSKVK